MVKVKGPCFSLEAQGTLGKTLIYQRSMGVQVVKKHGFDFSAEGYFQDLAKGQFSFVYALWYALHALTVAHWRSQSNFKGLRGYHYFFKQNLFAIWHWDYLVQVPPKHGFCVSGESYSYDLVTGGILSCPLIPQAAPVYGPEYSDPFILITYPNGSEEIEQGSEVEITWTSGNFPGPVDIYVSDDSGSTWTKIAFRIFNSGSYFYTFDQDPLTTYRIKIEASYFYYQDSSDSDFTIFITGPEFPTDGIISYWKLDEESAGPVVDSLGLCNGTNYGALINQTGLINKCYYFDGNDQVITTFSPNARIGNNHDFTINLWKKCSSANTDCVLFGSASDDHSVRFFIQLKNFNHYIFGWGANHVEIPIPGGADSANIWHMVTVVGNNSLTKVTYYIDAATPTSSTAFTGSRGTPTNNANFCAYKNNLYWTGYVDEIGIWNRQLTDEEIATLYNSGAGLSYPD